MMHTSLHAIFITNSLFEFSVEREKFKQTNNTNTNTDNTIHHLKIN